MKKLVYIVDDDVNVADIIAMVVEESGLEVRIFHDPREVISALQQTKRAPDLLISDYQMPHLNGLELISACKTVMPTLKAISVSGALTSAAVRAHEVKPDGILAKPFHPRELVEKISSVLGEALPPWPCSAEF